MLGLFCLCNCRRDRAKAVEILVKDLKVFSAFNEELFKEITHLLTLENFRYIMLEGSLSLFATSLNCWKLLNNAEKMSNYRNMGILSQLEA